MTSNGNILTVDDTPASLKLLKELLTNEGYQVRSAINGEWALRAAFINPPELILLDINMPDMNGFEVCQQLKSKPETQEIPIIFLSAHTATEEIIQGFNLGAVDFISKPFNREELLARVRTHLELYRLRNQLESLVEEKTRELTIERNRAQSYLDLVQVTIASFDRSGHISMINQAGKRLLGVKSDEEIIGRQWFNDILPQPDGMEAIYPYFQRMMDGALVETFDTEYSIITKSGEQRTVSSRNSVLYDEQGQSIGTLSAVDDITERKKAEEALQLASSVFESSSEAMLVTDADGCIITINPAFSATTGYSLDEVLGQNMRSFNSDPHNSEEFYREMEESLEMKGKWQGEIWDKRKDGSVFLKWLTINTIYNEDGSVHRRIALFFDITDKKQAEEMIWKQANFDTVTSLPNRFMFQDRLTQEIQHTQRTKQSVALMFLDLDRFKEINDTFGHSVGDMLLKEVAYRLRQGVRDSDTVARMGGDEFTIIMGQINDINMVNHIAENVLLKFSEPFLIGIESLYISTSIGIAFYPQDADNAENLIKNADQALYAAKEKGRNRYDYFIPSMQESALIRMKLINDLRSALSDNQFRLFYQPIVEFSSGNVHKAEALIRWFHPEQGMQSPAVFIAIAEQTGQINSIGDWIFLDAANQVKHWRSIGYPDFQVSINVSPVQFQNKEGLGSAWLDYLKRIDLTGHAIVFEITEGLLLDASGAIIEQLLEFRNANIEVSLDDFGTGYSSLAYLKKFDIDYLKIDQYFVRNLAAGTDDLVLIEAIVKMAHTLGLKVIAEGVETVEQMRLLIATGCDYGQGYLFAKPLPAEEFEKLLDSSGSKSQDLKNLILQKT